MSPGRPDELVLTDKGCVLCVCGLPGGGSGGGGSGGRLHTGEQALETEPVTVVRGRRVVTVAGWGEGGLYGGQVCQREGGGILGRLREGVVAGGRTGMGDWF